MGLMYAAELEIKDMTESNTSNSSSYLDLLLSVDLDDTLRETLGMGH